jgi:hypothetical protein
MKRGDWEKDLKNLRKSFGKLNSVFIFAIPFEKTNRRNDL